MKDKVFNTPEETEQFAAQLGRKLKGGECFEFSSDLGGGKTTFVRGLVAGSGSSDHVSSPTFTISKQYSAGTLQLYHFDFYRLKEPGLVAEELAEAVSDKSAVIVVEWAQTVQNVLPKNRIIVTLSKLADDPDARSCHIEYPESYEYVFTGETG